MGSQGTQERDSLLCAASMDDALLGFSLPLPCFLLYMSAFSPLSTMDLEFQIPEPLPRKVTALSSFFFSSNLGTAGLVGT